MNQEDKNSFDLNSDGNISPEELELMKEKKDERKQRSQKEMAWVALISMIVFAFLMFLPWVSENRIQSLDGMLSTFFIALAGVVGAYMGMSAYINRRK